ncbi:MAG: hypothetical protein AAF518_12205 [Spirochaetota bacterium]
MSTTEFRKILSKRLVNIFSDIENYQSPYALSVSEPSVIIKELTKKAAWKLSFISAGLALPPGYAAYATVLPEILLLYRVQGHLVKDIAALYGKEQQVTQELLLYCLFQKSQKYFLKNIVKEFSTRTIIRPMTFHAVESLVFRISERIANRYLRHSVSKFIPFSGLVLSSGKTYVDTLAIGKRSQEIFSKEIFIDNKSDSTNDA